MLVLLIKLTREDGKNVWLNTAKACRIERVESSNITTIRFETFSDYVKETPDQIMTLMSHYAALEKQCRTN